MTRFLPEDLEEIMKRPAMQEANPSLVAGSSSGRTTVQPANAGSSPAPAKPQKYHSRPTVYNGIRYHSQKEARFAAELDLRKKAGEVQFWLRQVPFDLTIGRYFLDFMVFIHRVKTERWAVEFIEIKGRDLPMGKRKRLETEKLYGIKVSVV